MDIYQLSDLMGRRKESGESYLEFLRVPSLSMGFIPCRQERKIYRSRIPRMRFIMWCTVRHVCG